MADNYAEFSAEIQHLTEDEAKWWEDILDCLNSETHLDKIPKSCSDNPYEVESAIDIQSIGNDTCLWIHGESGVTDGITDLVQLFFQQFRPNAFLPIETAFYCSKPIVGEFGGAWIVISANEVRCGDTSSAIREAMKEMGYVEE